MESKNNSILVEALNLNEFDINDMVLTDSIESNFKNIIYSYPFYTDDDYDYEYRITFENDNLILDEIKYDDNSDFDDCVKIITNIVTLPINEIKTKINANIDIRNNKPLISNDIMLLLNKNSPTFQEDLENNKKIILKDLYKDIKDTLFF
jgi:hypothetical protein